MVDVCSGMDYKHLSEGDIPVYGTGGYMLSVNKALSYDRNAVGIGRKGTIDKPYILKAPFWTVDTLFYAIPKDSKNIDFTFDVFQKVDWKKKDESTGVPSLSKIAINETSISTPSKLEQERIGSFFRNLDTLITLHQRKLEKLVQIRKAFAERCFLQSRKEFVMAFTKEADFEEAVVKLLIERGWKDGVLKNYTEQQLIQNWANILFENNRGIDRLNDYPLTDGEMQQIMEQVMNAKTPMKLNKFINGKSVLIKRDNPDDKLNFGKEVSLKIYDRLEIAAGLSRYQIAEQPKFPTKSKILNDRRRQAGSAYRPA